MAWTVAHRSSALALVAILVQSLVWSPPAAIAATAQDGAADVPWPPDTMCEPWPRFSPAVSPSRSPSTESSSSSLDPTARPAEASASAGVQDPIARSLVGILTDPRFTARVDFRSIQVRMGGMSADGEQLDAQAPGVSLMTVGSALLSGPDELVFHALTNGPWAMAELRRGESRFVHHPTTGTVWRRVRDRDAAVFRLPDLLSAVSDARRAPASEAPQGRWYDMTTMVAADPTTMWIDRLRGYPVIREAQAGLRVATDESGTPTAACLVQGWWQGVDEQQGEYVTVMSAMTFRDVGSALALPSPDLELTMRRVPELGLRIGVPDGWATRWDAEGAVFSMWRDDEDGAPVLMVRGYQITGDALKTLRKATTDQVVDSLVPYDVQSAKEGWGRDPLTVEMATIGTGKKGRAVTTGRLLLFLPDFGDTGPAVGLDVVTWREPWAYFIQFITPRGDDLPDRYLFERILESVRFDKAR